MEIVGVVKDTKRVNLRDDPSALDHRPYAQMGGTPVVRFAIRGSGELDTLATGFVQAARVVDPQTPVRIVVPFREIVHRTLVTERLVAHVSTAFIALRWSPGLSAARGGLRGGRRRRGTGGRIAVRASPGAVGSMILRESLVPLAAGILGGTRPWLP